MTAIPAALNAGSDDQAILLTLERFRAHELTAPETEKDLLLLFDAEVDREREPQLTKYVADVAQKVGSGELDASDAASDIREMMNYWLKQSGDLEHLLVLGDDE